jgi:hypothetical protein
MKALNNADAKARIEFTPQWITLAAASLASTSSPLIISAKERHLISLTAFPLYSTDVTKKVRLEAPLANASYRIIVKRSAKAVKVLGTIF